MKRIYVLRHAQYKYPVDDQDPLTPAGKQEVLELQKLLGKFELIFSSSKARCYKTAELLSGSSPIVDDRVGALDISKEDFDALVLKSKTNQYGMAGAAFETVELRNEVIRRGNMIVSLVKEIMKDLSNDKQGLIITHDAQMVAAEKILNNQSFDIVSYSYKPLEGFIVYEDLHTEKFPTSSIHPINLISTI